MARCTTFLQNQITKEKSEEGISDYLFLFAYFDKFLDYKLLLLVLMGWVGKGDIKK